MNRNYTKASTYRIMIVDDEEVIRMITTEGLMSFGFDIVDFASPMSALEYYKMNYRDIDLVILDMMMPEMNGDMLFYELKKINEFIQVIILSGYDDVDKKYHYLINDGLKSFLHKPICNEALNNEIASVLYNDKTIDVKVGLSTLVNNEQVYLRLLKLYHEEYYNLEEKIKSYISDYKFDGIKELVHKIKGVSLNLGSHGIYRLSTDLDQKLVKKEANISEINYFVNYHNLLIKDIERILEAQNV